MRLLTTIAVLKILLVAILTLGALPRRRATGAISCRSWRPAGAPPLAGAVAGAFVAAFFSFGGWWEVTKIAGEVRDP